MPIPTEVSTLIERFDLNSDAYRSPGYNEEDVRSEFIDPLFGALGWDVYNSAGHAEQYKDVVREHAIRVHGGMKSPDYAFRIGGTRKFFVEAKKPAERLKDHALSAFQLRRYAWSAKLPVSILTNFRELVVYDCRVEPTKDDKSSTARILLLNYKEYADRWDELANIFSLDAVLKGSFDAFALSMKGKRGTAEVDEAFLTEMQQWRELLARHCALRNAKLTERELNYAVQQTIDRIVFLRICEDRGIEHYGQLQDLLTGDRVYDRLKVMFGKADVRYNSGLFHFRPERGRREEPDRLTLRLTIEDQPLRRIIGRLYYPDSPYEFRVLPADILGQVYEQFLGQVIRLTRRHRAKIEDKPEVRKAGGVYYTPTQIVDYIVAQTLGALVKDKTPRQVAKLKVLDPACGSGSFLIAAYQFLLDWHLGQYLADGAERHKGELYQVTGNEWRLSTRERKRILLNSIYGVDIDSQAVEVTKLSLVLKVLEGETEDTLNTQLRLFAERALPDLGDNIKCGNSLVGTDVQASLLEEEDRRVNPFDWESEFPDIMRSGGFDAVIGNPPYDVLEKERGASSWPHSALTKYVQVTPEYEPALGGKTNLFRFFIVRSLRLTRSGGRFGMIVPLALLADISVASTRRHLMLSALHLLADCFPQKDNAKRRVFRKAKLSTCVITCERVGRVPERSARIRVRVYPWNSFEDAYRESSIRLADAALLNPNNIPIPLTDEANWKECKRVHSSPNVARLGTVSDFAITRGEINQTIYRRYITSDGSKARLLKGVEVGPYHLNEELSQGEREWFDQNRFLRDHSARSVIDKRRIATQRITGVDERRRIVATIVDPPCYFADSTNSIVVSEGSPYRLEFLLGLLNSTFFQWRFRLTSTNNNVGTNELEDMPFRLVDFGAESDSALHDRMVALVTRMFTTQRTLADAQLGVEQVAATRRIHALHRDIDKLVYQMYAMRPQGIQVVEQLEELPALTA